MPSDIVERLRHCSENCGDEYLHELAGRAADTITTLRAENEKLRAALEWAAAKLGAHGFPDLAHQARSRALAEEKQG